METAISITKSKIRAALESARGFANDDQSEEAQAARRIDSLGDLDGLVIVARLTIKKQPDYADKNTIAEIVTPSCITTTACPERRRRPNGRSHRAMRWKRKYPFSWEGAEPATQKERSTP
jgi:hypothetical protein